MRERVVPAKPVMRATPTCIQLADSWLCRRTVVTARPSVDATVERRAAPQRGAVRGVPHVGPGGGAGALMPVCACLCAPPVCVMSARTGLQCQQRWRQRPIRLGVMRGLMQQKANAAGRGRGVRWPRPSAALNKLAMPRAERVGAAPAGSCPPHAMTSRRGHHLQLRARVALP